MLNGSGAAERQYQAKALNRRLHHQSETLNKKDICIPERR
jgi:hypothetical protein